MAELLPQELDLSPAKRALLTLRRMRARLERLERAAHEPVAIVGMACRFPGGVEDPDGLWELLLAGGDAVTRPPAGRFDAVAAGAEEGSAGVRWGGFVEGVDRFDARFFGMQPEQAERIDPQQRLLMELTWEAFEDAGIPLDSLRGAPVAVFIGSSTHDYGLAQMRRGEASLDAAMLQGAHHSILSARLAYLFDFRGPCMTLDAACSSALLAAHLACESLRRGESDLALAGGVNVMLVPDWSIAFDNAGFLAPDGRCKAFDAGADGFARSEGCGVVVLKRLSDAEAAEDPIRAVIRGSAVNQNGRSASIVAPNGPVQQAVIRRALDAAGVEGGSIGYLEAHGTGTLLGDSIELEALKAVVGSARPDGPCSVGSIKANLGHLEAASGIAALIKAALTLEREFIPPQIHYHRLNPHVALDGGSLVIAKDGRAWSAGEKPRRAGVHCYSLSGGNAHLVLEEAPRPAPREVPASGGEAFLLPLSARDDEALRRLATSMASWLRRKGDSVSLRDVCFSAAVRRAHHPQRLAVVASSVDAFISYLEAYARQERGAGGAAGRASPGRRRRCAFVFPDQAAQWTGMLPAIRELGKPAQETLERCDAFIREYASWSLLDEHPARREDGDPGRALPRLVAAELALAAQWRCFGVEPEAVLGHGRGELAAAHVAGVLSLEQTLQLAMAPIGDAQPTAVVGSVAGPGPERAVLPLWSASAGAELRAGGLEMQHWQRALEPPSRLDAAVAELVESGVDVLVEVAPHPLVAGPLRRVLAERRPDGIVVGSVCRGEPPAAALLRSVATLYVAGIPVEWRRLAPKDGRCVRLPHYPWHHEPSSYGNPPPAPAVSSRESCR